MARVLVCIGEKYALPCILDDIDYEWAIGEGNWLVTHAGEGNPQYAARTYYRPETKTKRLVFLHKAVLIRTGIVPPTPLHRIGDHINGDKLDNRRENLRWATAGMNARNRFGFAAQQVEMPLMMGAC